MLLNLPLILWWCFQTFKLRGYNYFKKDTLYNSLFISSRINMVHKSWGDKKTLSCAALFQIVSENFHNTIDMYPAQKTELSAITLHIGIIMQEFKL